MKKLGVAGLIIISLLGVGTGCKVPKVADPDQKENPVVVIGDGTTLNKSNWGIWTTDSKVHPNCKWSIVQNGKTIGKGGPHDAIVSAIGTKGGVVSATGCGLFYK